MQAFWWPFVTMHTQCVNFFNNPEKQLFFFFFWRGSVLHKDHMHTHVTLPMYTEPMPIYIASDKWHRHHSRHAVNKTLLLRHSNLRIMNTGITLSDKKNEGKVFNSHRRVKELRSFQWILHRATIRYKEVRVYDCGEKRNTIAEISLWINP